MKLDRQDRVDKERTEENWACDRKVNTNEVESTQYLGNKNSREEQAVRQVPGGGPLAN